jgi:desulfoferrodoxin (superoxide reductase-like protein)
VKLDRRGFLLTSFRLGAATALLPACDPGADTGPAEGTFGRPYHRDDPGPWAEKIETHQPIIYASRIDAERVRLWVEVLDLTQTPPLPHPMVVDHWIDQLVLQDNFGNIIDNRSFAFDAQARLVATVSLPDRVRQIEALASCNLHGWWRTVYDVGELEQPPVGDVRRSFTRDAPGEYQPQVPTHIPVFGRRPNGNFAVEVGDRDLNLLHPMDPGHYIQEIRIYDQYDQLRALATLGPAYQEPVADFAQFGTQRVRVVVQCNTYQWWEATYAVG